MRARLTLAALAATFACGGAFAQANPFVTIFGTVDVNVAHGRGAVADRTQVSNNGIGASQLGFRGVEVLGNGLNAGFHLEMSHFPDNGTGSATNTNNQSTGGAPAGMNGGQGLTFNRRSTVSIGGNWGELRLGRDYTPSYWPLAVFDPYGNLGVGTAVTTTAAITGFTGVRASNGITYVYGQAFNAAATGATANGFNGSLMYYVGENASNAANSDDGRGWSGRVGWNKGPLWVSLAAGRTEYLAGDVTQSNLAASYDFGVARILGLIERDKNGALDGKGFLIGALIPVGVHQIRASYSSYETDAPGEPGARKIALGYVYNFSRRTAVYAVAAHLRNRGGAAFALNGSITTANGSSSGLDIGIRHAF